MGKILRLDGKPFLGTNEVPERVGEVVRAIHEVARQALADGDGTDGQAEYIRYALLESLGYLSAMHPALQASLGKVGEVVLGEIGVAELVAITSGQVTAVRYAQMTYEEVAKDLMPVGTKDEKDAARKLDDGDRSPGNGSPAAS